MNIVVRKYEETKVFPGQHTGTVPVTQLHTTLQAGHPVSAGWLHSLLVLLCLSSHVGFCLSYAPSLWSLAHSLCCVVLCIFSSPLCVRAGRAACLPRCAPRCGCQGRGGEPLRWCFGACSLLPAPCGRVCVCARAWTSSPLVLTVFRFTRAQGPDGVWVLSVPFCMICLVSLCAVL